MIECNCGNQVKTKYCPQCGAECNGDSDLLKWIAECKTNLKYWVDKDDANPSDGTGDLAIGKKCRKMKAMWNRRINILQEAMQAELGQKEGE